MSQNQDEQTRRGPGAEPRRNEIVCRAEDLKGFLELLAGQIADADRRHTEALREMHDRLARLGGHTESLKSSLPRQYVEAFERIEEGMAELAQRLSDADRARDWQLAPPQAPAQAPASHAAPAPQVAVMPQAPLADEPAADDVPLYDGPHFVDPDAPAAPASSPAAILRPAHPMGEPQRAQMASGPAGSFADEPLHATPEPHAHHAPRSQSEPPPALRSALSTRGRPDWTRSEPAQAAAEPPARPAPPAPVFVQNPDEPWDHHSAADLARLYESGEPGLPPLRGVMDPSVKPAAPVAPIAAPVALAAVSTPPPIPAPMAAPVIEREWLEERLAAVAARVEESLTEMRPDAAIADIGRRFEQLEHRLDSAFDGVARQADVEGLKLVEAHITELTSQVETLRSELARFSGLEAQIGELRSQLSDDQIVRLFGSLVPTEQDLVRFAEDAAHRAAEQVVSRLPAQPVAPAVHAPSPADDERMSRLHELLSGYVAERRREEVHTSEALDTMQQAMRQILDRVDAMETRRPELPQPLAQHFDREPPRFAADSAPYQPPQHMAPDAGSTSRNFADEAKAAAKAAASALAHRPAPGRTAPPQGRAMRVEPELSVPAAIAAAAPQSAPPSPGDRRAFMDIARRAAERAKAVDPEPEAGPAPRTEARNASKPAVDPAASPSLKDRLFGGKGDAKAQGGKGGKNLTGVLLVASVFLFMLAGYYLLASPRNKQVARAVPVEQTAPAPAQGEQKPAGDSGSVPQEPSSGKGGATPGAPAEAPAAAPKGPVPGRAAAASPTAIPGSTGQTIATAAGIALHEPARRPTPTDLMRARQKHELATLSERTGRDASSLVAGASRLAPRDFTPGSVAAPLADDDDTPGIAASQARAAGSAAATPIRFDGQAPAQPQSATAPAGASRVELPPALIGPLSLRLAASRGDPSAQFEVALRFAEGKGVKQDFREAAVWYQRAATQGLAAAQYRLGTLLERGVGVTADVERARAWYKRAAAQGNIKAMHNLAVLSAGNDAATADYVAAAGWFTQAAEHGLVDSQYNLAVLFESGLGVEKDLAQAYKWYALAARGGDKEAERRRGNLKGRMDAKNVASIEATVARWHPKPQSQAANDPYASGEAWKTRNAAAPQAPSVSN